MARKKSKIILNLTPFVIILIIFFLVAVFTIKFFKNSSYFKIKEIICSEPGKQAEIYKILDLRNKNIFSIDLKLVTKKIKENYPEIAEIEVSRELPNKLIVTFRKRTPVAKFRLSNNYFVIDSQGVVLSYSKDLGNQNLIVIGGLSFTFKDLKIGQTLKSKNVSIALSLLKQINHTATLKQYKISELNISNLNKLSLFVNDVEIIMLMGDFKEKLNLLSSLLAQLEPELKGISYIDLRFKDPIIKKK